MEEKIKEIRRLVEQLSTYRRNEKCKGEIDGETEKMPSM